MSIRAGARRLAGARNWWVSVMPVQLRDDLHWCDCDGRAVFLDLRADRYFCLPKLANDAFLRLAAQQAEPGDSEKMQFLFQRGLLIETCESASMKTPPTIEAPTHDFLGEPFPRIRPVHIIRALAEELRVAWLLRTKPLLRILEAVERRSPLMRPAAADPARSLEAIAAASSATAYVTRAHNRCLVRALAVHAACARRGIRTKLVFGVIGHPFGAHCWVQLGSSVLVGGFEQARLFTPILVLQ